MSSAPHGDVPQKSPARKRRTALIAVTACAALVLGGGIIAFAVVNSQQQAANSSHSADTEPSPTQAPHTTPSPTPTPVPTPGPEPEPEPTEQTPPAPSVGSFDDPNSIQIVVNKLRPLSPIGWAPTDLAYPEIPNVNGQPLRYEAAVALEQMYAEARAAGVPFALVSGFRSYELQTTLFNNYVAGHGVESAETFSARPGHSEHQTGLAADISECSGCPLSEAFGSTSQGQWARANAFRFGFILRYDLGSQPIVGYMYEPWHFRYVGVDVAGDMKNRGITTLEEYYGLPAAPTY